MRIITFWVKKGDERPWIVASVDEASLSKKVDWENIKRKAVSGLPPTAQTREFVVTFDGGAFSSAIDLPMVSEWERMASDLWDASGPGNVRSLK